MIISTEREGWFFRCHRMAELIRQLNDLQVPLRRD
jgi:hypothetical protein